MKVVKLELLPIALRFSVVLFDQSSLLSRGVHGGVGRGKAQHLGQRARQVMLVEIFLPEYRFEDRRSRKDRCVAMLFSFWLKKEFFIERC